MRKKKKRSRHPRAGGGGWEKWARAPITMPKGRKGFSDHIAVLRAERERNEGRKDRDPRPLPHRMRKKKVDLLPAEKKSLKKRGGDGFDRRQDRQKEGGRRIKIYVVREERTWQKVR